MNKKSELQAKIELLKNELGVAEKESKKIEEETKFAYKKLISFELCCKETGNNPKDKKFTESTPDTNAYEMLKVITKAINGNEEMGDNEYFPYFNKNKKPGSGFFQGSCDRYWSVGGSHVSSRLALVDSSRALHSGEHFEAIHYAYMVIPAE